MKEKNRKIKTISRNKQCSIARVTQMEF